MRSSTKSDRTIYDTIRTSSASCLTAVGATGRGSRCEPTKALDILLHENHQDQVQRLLIGLEPDSYVRPHLHSEQWEMVVLLRGRLDFLIFSAQAELVQRLSMSVASPVVQIGQRADRPT